LLSCRRFAQRHTLNAACRTQCRPRPAGGRLACGPQRHSTGQRSADEDEYELCAVRAAHVAAGKEAFSRLSARAGPRPTLQPPCLRSACEWSRSPAHAQAVGQAPDRAGPTRSLGSTTAAAARQRRVMERPLPENHPRPTGAPGRIRDSCASPYISGMSGQVRQDLRLSALPRKSHLVRNEGLCVVGPALHAS
jgi:hypothetical protein